MHFSSQVQFTVWTLFLLHDGPLHGFQLQCSCFPLFQNICYNFLYIGVFVIIVPNAPPANVMRNNVTSTSIFVQWDEVPADNQNGIIVNYTVTHTKLPDGSPTDEVIVIAPKRNATLKRLKEFTNYSITVFASTAKGGGNRSERIIVITDEDSEYNSRMFINSFFFVL